MKCDELKRIESDEADIYLSCDKYVYEADSVDAVLAEKDKTIVNRDDEIKKLKNLHDTLLKAKTEQIIHEVIQKTLIYGEGFIHVEYAMKLIAELRHHKYKRCLAMARMCSEALCYWDNVKYTFFKGETYCFRKMDHYGKWGQIWLAIAEKFKEAK